MMPGLDWPMLRNCFISEIQARLKTAVVLERLEVWSHVGLWQLPLVGPCSSETFPPGTVHVPCCTPSLCLTSAWHLLAHRDSSSHILASCFSSLPFESSQACYRNVILDKRNLLMFPVFWMQQLKEPSLCVVELKLLICYLCDHSHQGNSLLWHNSHLSPVSYIWPLHVDVVLRSLNLVANFNPVQKIVLYFSVICWFWFYSDPLRIQRKLLNASLQSGIDYCWESFCFCLNQICLFNYSHTSTFSVICLQAGYLLAEPACHTWLFHPNGSRDCSALLRATSTCFSHWG